MFGPPTKCTVTTGPQACLICGWSEILCIPYLQKFFGILSSIPSVSNAVENEVKRFYAGVNVSRADIEVPVTVEHCYDLWSDRELIPRWMPWIHSVKVCLKLKMQHPNSRFGVPCNAQQRFVSSSFRENIKFYSVVGCGDNTVLKLADRFWVTNLLYQDGP